MAVKRKLPQNRRTHPNSLANLRPCKKGEVRNPEGGRAGMHEITRMRRLTTPEIAEIGELILMNNVAALQAVIDDSRGPNKENSKHTSLKVWFAMIAMRGISKGDPYALDVFLTRVVGKSLFDDSADKPAITKAVVPADERRREIERYQRILAETQEAGIEKMQPVAESFVEDSIDVSPEKEPDAAD